MARNLEFDYEKAIERGTRVFWGTGYANTSLRELLKMMRIGEGSFYNTFKSKKLAYIECLKHYNATVGLERAKAFEAAPTAAEGIRAIFAAILDLLDHPKTPSRVCMMARALNPEVLADAELRQYIEEHMSRLSDRITARLTADKKNGLLPDDFNPRVVVPIVITYIQGLTRMALVSYDRHRFEQQIDAFLTGLRL